MLTTFGSSPISTSLQLSNKCVLATISLRCDQSEHVLVLHKVQLATSKTGSCNYSKNDCFEDRTNVYNICGGKPLCVIFAPSISLKSCNNSRSNYLYTVHQCIPTRTQLDLNICSTGSSTQIVQDSTIISSLNYTSEHKQCKIQLQTNSPIGNLKQKGFKIYILTLNLPISLTTREQGLQCGANDPSIEIDDPDSGVTRLCGYSHARYLFQTCSNIIEIRYKNAIVDTGSVEYTGFEIYVESTDDNECRSTLTTGSGNSPSILTTSTGNNPSTLTTSTGKTLSTLGIGTANTSSTISSNTTVTDDMNETTSKPNLALIIGLSVGLGCLFASGVFGIIICHAKIIKPKKQIFISHSTNHGETTTTTVLSTDT